MKHLGNISALSGFTLPAVDCVTGGSPCQDLSIAGKRAGLAGERSGLFMEQIRIIREMRDADKLLRGNKGSQIRPRFMVWENVAGAFSSNKGQDFAAVIEETIKIVEGNPPHVPMPKNGWPKSGCVYDEMGRWSIAWRLHDSQFWGVAQRRVRIALVADFGGLAAPEVLFIRKGLSWDSAESGEAQEDVAAGAENGSDKAIGVGVENDIAATLDASYYKGQGERCGIERTAVLGFHLTQDPISIVEKTPCLSTGNTHGKATIGVYDARGNGDSKTVCTLTGDHQNRITDYTAIVLQEKTSAWAAGFKLGQGAKAGGIGYQEEVAPTLSSMDNGNKPAVACYSNNAYDTWTENEVGATQRASGGIYGGGSETLVKSSVVRRLTPLECERLQGYPDGWTDIGEWEDTNGQKRQASDSNRYKALGNSIALPFWFWLLRRISAIYERPATLGSLFDGIGGFPLCWERCNGKGTALWASEIEEFCIAVTKRHFGKD